MKSPLEFWDGENDAFEFLNPILYQDDEIVLFGESSDWEVLWKKMKHGFSCPKRRGDD